MMTEAFGLDLLHDWQIPEVKYRLLDHSDVISTDPLL